MIASSNHNVKNVVYFKTTDFAITLWAGAMKQVRRFSRTEKKDCIFIPEKFFISLQFKYIKYSNS